MKNTPTVSQGKRPSRWRPALATFDAALRARGMSEKTRRAYGIDLEQLAEWADHQELGPRELDDVDADAEGVRVSGKGGRTRVVPAGEPAWRALDRYVSRARPRLAVAAAPGPDGREERALFLSRRGRRLSTSDVRRRLRLSV